MTTKEQVARAFAEAELWSQGNLEMEWEEWWPDSQQSFIEKADRFLSDLGGEDCLSAFLDYLTGKGSGRRRKENEK